MAWGRGGIYSDQVAYQSRVWQAYRGTGNDVRIKTVKFDGTDFRDFSVGGVTYVRPTIWTDYWHSFICVGARGTDNALYHMASADGLTWPAAWENHGGVLTDAPVARSYRDGRYVYTAQGTDGRYRKVWNGSWGNWEASYSTEIALGTNLIDWDSEASELMQSLDVLRPEVVRVRFGARRLDILDALINTYDARTIVFNGSDEGLTWEDFWAEANASYGGLTAFDLAKRYPHHNFIWELGNEPDRTTRWGSNAAGARDEVVRTANTWRVQQASHPNFQLGVSLPTREGSTTYFDTFCNAGATLDAFDVVCVHGYGNTCIADGNGDGWGIVNRAKQLTQRAIYITETNLSMDSLRLAEPWKSASYADCWQEIGKRLVNGLSQWDGPDGQVRGVSMFETEFRNIGPGNWPFHMDTEPKNVPLPRLGHQALRQRARSSSGCP